MIDQIEARLDTPLTHEFGGPKSEGRIRRTAAAMEANGLTVLRASNAAQAREIVLGLVPDGSEVLNGASRTSS